MENKYKYNLIFAVFSVVGILVIQNIWLAQQSI